MSIIGIVENKTKQSKSAADLAMAARGGAIAHLFVSHIRDAATSMKRFLVDIQGLTHEGRIGFRTSLGEELKAMRKNLKSAEGTVNEASWKSSSRSYGVRISEAVTFSRDVDAGYSPEMEGMNYHALIGEARVFLDAESTTGPTVKRGRKATPTLDKVKAYLEKAKLSAAECEAVAEFVATLAAPKA